MLGVSLSQLLGQTEVSAFLKGVVAGGRFANAYLFHGPAGVGKCTAALAFARAMMCERAPGAASAAPDLFAAAADEPAGGGARSRRGGAMRGAAADPARDDACGACGSCVKSATLQHPDLRFLFPVSGEEKALENTVIEILEALRADPLFVFGYEKAASIRLSLTRDLLRELAYKPYEAVRRVVVVRDADRMREDQCSAMLKSIEEPGASTVWILTTARLARGLHLGGVRGCKRAQVALRCGAQAERGKGVVFGALDDHVMMLRQNAAQVDGLLGTRRDVQPEIEEVAFRAREVAAREAHVGHVGDLDDRRVGAWCEFSHCSTSGGS